MKRMMAIAALTALAGLMAPASADEQAEGTVAIALPAPPSMPNANPCEHRIFCGQLLPADRTERMAFLARIGLQIADGIVTANGLREQSKHPDLWRSSRLCSTPLACTYNSKTISSFGFAVDFFPSLRPTFESDALAAPFSHGGLPTILAGGLLWNFGMAHMQRSWTSMQRTSFDIGESIGHVYGIATWERVAAHRRAWDADYFRCADLTKHYAVLAPINGSKLGFQLLGAPGGMQYPSTCQRYTALPLQGVSK